MFVYVEVSKGGSKYIYMDETSVTVTLQFFIVKGWDIELEPMFVCSYSQQKHSITYSGGVFCSK